MRRSTEGDVVVKIICACVVSLIVLAGCGQSDKPQPKTQPAKPSGSSSVKLAVDGVTGRYAVNAGTQAMNQIKNISANEKKDLDEVMK
jgi:hypothetical protein